MPAQAQHWTLTHAAIMLPNLHEPHKHDHEPGQALDQQVEPGGIAGVLEQRQAEADQLAERQARRQEALPVERRQAEEGREEIPRLLCSEQTSLSVLRMQQSANCPGGCCAASSTGRIAKHAAALFNMRLFDKSIQFVFMKCVA